MTREFRSDRSCYDCSNRKECHNDSMKFIPFTLPSPSTNNDPHRSYRRPSSNRPEMRAVHQEVFIKYNFKFF